jgi:hypothetical protein
MEMTRLSFVVFGRGLSPPSFLLVALALKR